MKKEDMLKINSNLTVADFFCGAGGFSEGFRQAGFEIVFALDNWNVARKTHKLNHPSAKHPGLDCHLDTKGDILAIDVNKINEIVDDVDVIVGSPPCVSFSSSNKAGKANKDLGIVLIEKFLQIVAVKKHIKNSSLKYWAMENVPNSRKYVKNKYTFKELGLNKINLKQLNIKKKEDDVALELDTSEDMIFDSVYYKVPQRRTRFITGEFPKPEKLTPNEKSWITLGHVISVLNSNDKLIKDPNNGFSIKRDTLTDHFYDTTIPRFEWEEALIKKQQARYYGKMSFPENFEKPSRTVIASRHVTARESIILPNKKKDSYRTPTIREIASLMSFPISYLFEGESEASKYRLVGNAVCPKLSFAIASQILKNSNTKVNYNSNPNSDISKHTFDLRRTPPKLRKARNKPLDASFVEIVPDLKFSNFRIELDNNFPKKNNKLKWSASIHHATGKESMKYAKIKSNQMFKLLNNIKNINFKSFKREADLLVNLIPKAKIFQEQHCLTKINNNFISPRESLKRTSKLIEKYFPKNKYEHMAVSNLNKNGNEIIKFSRGQIPKNEIPLRIIAGAYVVSRIAENT